MATVKALVVGGGAAGGGRMGGGGGAGGIDYDPAYGVAAGDYDVVIGAGGTGVDEQAGNPGSDSSFDATLIGYGGGYGCRNFAEGGPGGCGGGGGDTNQGGTGSQGGDGGDGVHPTEVWQGGGGGMFENGDDGVIGKAGDGGDGVDYSADFGTAYGENGVFAAGGGGGTNGRPVGESGLGGLGGGGDSGYNTHHSGFPALANTGSGGGAAAWNDGAPAIGGQGADGIVLIAYLTADFGECTGGIITTFGDYTIHAFTSSGTFTVVELPATSPSPSPGYENYTRGEYETLPTDNADLTNNYTTTDYTDVGSSNDVRVSQTTTSGFMVHQFKDFTLGHPSGLLHIECQVSKAPTASTVYLQIYNVNTTTWETVGSDSTSSSTTDFVIEASIADLTDYRDAEGLTTSRVYQEIV